jgi:hypothetical protein
MRSRGDGYSCRPVFVGEKAMETDKLGHAREHAQSALSRVRLATDPEVKKVWQDLDCRAFDQGAASADPRSSLAIPAAHVRHQTGSAARH